MYVLKGLEEAHVSIIKGLAHGQPTPLLSQCALSRMLICFFLRTWILLGAKFRQTLSCAFINLIWPEILHCNENYQGQYSSSKENSSAVPCFLLSSLNSVAENFLFKSSSSPSVTAGITALPGILLQYF